MYSGQVLMHRFSFHVSGHGAPLQKRSKFVQFPRKNLPNVLAARDENERRVSEEDTGWGDSVNAALRVCAAAHR